MINRHKITEYLSNNELFDLLNLAKNVGNQEFILKYKPLLGDLATFVADQNSLSVKAKVKLPSFYNLQCIYTARSLEQCTSEEVARYKATKIKGHSLLSLASGIGADDVALSKSFQSITSVDSNAELNAIAIHNFNLLGIKNIERITTLAETLLKKKDQAFDTVYIDPDRRNEQERQILLSQHSPDVIKLLPDLLKIAKDLWIKCSPLYDLDMALQEIKTISEIYCISQKGEVKEMLVRVSKNKTDNIQIICTDIGAKKINEVVFQGEDFVPEVSKTVEGFFFEAGSSLVKMRKNHTYAYRNQLTLIDPKVPFYIGTKAIPDFMGKCLRILNSFAFNPKQIKLYLKSKEMTRINIKARGVKTDIGALFRKLEVREGGNEFLFICPFNGKNMVIHCAPLEDLSSVVDNEI